MGRNLTNLPISSSFQYLLQVSGSEVNNGLGADIDTLNLNIVGTASTASYVAGANVDGSVASASFATTASFAENVVPQDTGSFMTTGSATDATLTFTKGDASTFDLTVNNVDNANTASVATSASHAIIADTASFLPSDTNLNINSISASSATFSSASIGYLQTITGSAKIIGDAYIILNNNTPTQRYAGLVVQDSGSGSPLTTASFEFDGQSNDWFYEYSDDGGATTDHGIALFGPEYSTKGSPTYNANNKLVKGDGGHHLNDSNITDDGTLVTIDSNVSASGYISASKFIGDGSSLSNLPESGLTLGGTATSLQSSLTTTPATASGAGDIAIGDGAIAQGGDAISIGKNANDTNKDAQAIAIGKDTEATFSTIALGYQADASNYGMALGAYSTNRGGVSLGRSANATGGNATAIGGDAIVAGQSGVAVGTQANAGNNYSVAIGALARATGSLSFVIKTNQADLMTATTASQDVTFYGTASAPYFVGDGSGLTSVGELQYSGSTYFATTGSGTVNYDRGVVIGHDAQINGSRGTAIGEDAQADAEATALGWNTTATSRNIAVGFGASTSTNQKQVSIGWYPETTGNAAIAIGEQPDATGNHSIAVGHFAAASQTNTIAVGSGSAVAAEDSVAIGGGANITSNGVGSVVIGNNVSTDSATSVVIGSNLTMPANTPRNVLIGSGSIVGAGADDSVTIGTNAESEGGDDVVSIGTGANGYNASAVAIGQFTSADFCGVAIGASARSQGQNAVSIGRSCQSSALDSIGIGQRANRASGATGAAALGAFTDADNAYGTALGYGAQATGSLAMEWRVNQSPLMSATTASQDITFYGTASAPYFVGDGSQLTNLPTGGGAAGLVSGSGTNSMQSAGFLTTTPATASGINAIAIGEDARATNTRNIAIGTGVDATGNEDAICIGRNSAASGIRAIVIGESTSTVQTDAIRIGRFGSVDGTNGVAIGQRAEADGPSAVGVGSNAIARADDSIAIGHVAVVSNVANQGIAIGHESDTTVNYGISFGFNTNATSANGAMALGYLAEATGSVLMDIRAGGNSVMQVSTGSADVIFPQGIEVEGSVKKALKSEVNSISITSNTGSLDCSSGNMFTITLAAGVDTHLDATNLQAGQTINLKITNNAVTAGTISFSPDFEFEGGTPFTATASPSAVDVMTFVSFDGTSLQATGLKNFS